MGLSPYEKKILEAFNKVSTSNQGKGASPAEVTKQMREDETLSPADTVIDIADLMNELSTRGYFVR
jgi:Asp-tRNA(Asn)/Glu-tRNA(Gln) amidotransferase C subunit